MDFTTEIINSLAQSVLEIQPELVGAGDELREEFAKRVTGLTSDQEHKVYSFIAVYLSDTAQMRSPALDQLNARQMLESIATVFAAASFAALKEETLAN